MTETKLRLDKWLWAARFFKTRSLATEAVTGGHVHANGQRAKPSYAVQPGDELRITKAQQTFVIHVDGLSEKRGPAREAEQLYTETAASRESRLETAAQRRAVRVTTPRPAGRPDKKGRRELRRLKSKQT